MPALVPASERQRAYLSSLLARAGESAAESDLDALSRGHASMLIDGLVTGERSAADVAARIVTASKSALNAEVRAERHRTIDDPTATGDDWDWDAACGICGDMLGGYPPFWDHVGGEPQLDHIVPRSLATFAVEDGRAVPGDEWVSRGDHPDNLQWAHKACNLRKGATPHMDRWRHPLLLPRIVASRPKRLRYEHPRWMVLPTFAAATALLVANDAIEEEPDPPPMTPERIAASADGMRGMLLTAPPENIETGWWTAPLWLRGSP